MKHSAARWLTTLFLTATFWGAIPVDADDDDPPIRAARLSYLSGEVSIAPANNDSWVEAKINRPLTTGDQLWTADRARAELQLGSATLHTDENTNLSLLELSDKVAQLRLTEGALAVRVRHLEDDEILEIDTPNSAVSLLEPGVYRIDVDANGGATTVRVRSGHAEVNGDRQSYTLDRREKVVFRGPGRGAAEFSDMDPQDDFERWAATRNEHAEGTNTSRYVADGVVGYEDLDNYGYWHSDAEFGSVWIPTTVAVGWAPYRFGHWVWIAPWGWTWVDDAPWGFAPFHYGRWAYRANRWCWVPGPRQVRPVYAPALVAWVGGPGVNVSISIGPDRVGWLPLGPREVYVPGYRSSRGYLHNVNIANARISATAHIDDVFDQRISDLRYTNRAAPGAFSVIARNDFLKGRTVANHMVHLDQRALGQAPLQPRPPALQPERDSMFGPGRRFAPPPSAINRPVIALREPRTPPQLARGQIPPQTAKASVNVVRPPRAEFRGRAFSGRGSNESRLDLGTGKDNVRAPQRGFPAPGGQPPELRSEQRQNLPTAVPEPRGERDKRRENPERPVVSQSAPEQRRFAPRPAAEPPRGATISPPHAPDPNPRERSAVSPWVQRESRLRDAPAATVQHAPEPRRPDVQAPRKNAQPERGHPEARQRFPNQEERR